MTSVDPRLVGLAAAEQQRQQDVLLGGQRRHQVERLEDEAQALPAQQGELLVGQFRDQRVADASVAPADRVEPGHAVQQRRLARARTGP
jgi:hypothetical protein